MTSSTINFLAITFRLLKEAPYYPVVLVALLLALNLVELQIHLWLDIAESQDRIISDFAWGIVEKLNSYSKNIPIMLHYIYGVLIATCSHLIYSTAKERLLNTTIANLVANSAIFVFLSLITSVKLLQVCEGDDIATWQMCTDPYIKLLNIIVGLFVYNFLYVGMFIVLPITVGHAIAIFVLNYFHDLKGIVDKSRESPL